MLWIIVAVRAGSGTDTLLSLCDFSVLQPASPDTHACPSSSNSNDTRPHFFQDLYGFRAAVYSMLDVDGRGDGDNVTDGDVSCCEVHARLRRDAAGRSENDGV